MIAGKYRVLDVLGQGGFGTVYRVEITAGMVGEQVALKILPPELSTQQAFRDQFLNEIRVAMRVVDRYIAQIRDVGTTESGLLYYTMDLCPGVTLAQILRAEGPLPVARTILVILNVLRGLQTAHASGIIHRDLKPGNIMVERQGGKDTVRILDFGIATAIHAPGDRQRAFAGSPPYMAPEQFLGERLTFATDLYSIGVILYECLAGAKPHPGATAQEVFTSLKTRTLPPLEDVVAETRAFPGLAQVVSRSLEKNPEKRYQSARELFDALQEVLARGTTQAAGNLAAESPAATPSASPAVSSQQSAAAQDPDVQEAANRIRRRRQRRSRGARNAPQTGAIAFGALVVGGTIAGLVFRNEISSWFNSHFGAGTAKVEAPSGVTPAPGPVASPAQKKPNREPPAKPAQKSLEEQKSEVRAEAAARATQLTAEAQRALADRDAAKAVSLAETALGLDARNGAAHLTLGLAALSLEDHARAVTELEAARTLLPGTTEDTTRSELLTALARAYLRRAPSDPGKAEVAAREATRIAPRSAAAAETLVEVFLASDQVPEAQLALERAEANKVESPGLAGLSARVKAADGARRKTAAAKAAEEARAAQTQGDLPRALELATKALELWPHAEAGRIAADLLLEKRDFMAASKLLEGILQRFISEQVTLEDNEARALEARRLLAQGVAGIADARVTPGEDELIKAEGALRAAREKATGLKASLGIDRGLEQASLALASKSAARGDAAGVDRLVRSLLQTQELGVQLELGRVHVQLSRNTKAAADQLRALRSAVSLLERAARAKGAPAVLAAECNFLLGSSLVRTAELEKKEAGYRLSLAPFAAAEKAGLKTPELYEQWAVAYERLGNLIRRAQLLRSAYDAAPGPEACLRAVEAYLEANSRSEEARELLRLGLRQWKDDVALARKHREVLGDP